MAVDLLGGGAFLGDDEDNNTNTAGGRRNSKTSKKNSQNNSKTNQKEVAMTVVEDDQDELNLGVYEPIKQEIAKIDLNRKQITKLSSRYRASATADSDKAITKELEKIMTNNATLARRIKEELQKESQKFQINRRKLSMTQSLQQQNLLNSVTRKFKTSCIEFETTLQQFVQNLRDKQIRQIKILDTEHKLSNDDIEELVDDPVRANDVIQKQFQMVDVGDALLDALANMEEKYEGMKRIEKEIEELKELFLELSTLVHEQQSMIDSIEDHVNDTKKFVESGVVYLQKAEATQKCTRKMKIMGCCCCFISFIIIILAVFEVEIN